MGWELHRPTPVTAATHWLAPADYLPILGAIIELSGSFSGKGALRLTDLAERLRGDPRIVEFDILPRKD